MNWIKAKPEVLQEYNVDTSTCRVLSSGDVIKHFELTSNVWSVMKDDKRITFWTHEAMMEFLTWTEPSEVEHANI